MNDQNHLEKLRLEKLLAEKWGDYIKLLENILKESPFIVVTATKKPRGLPCPDFNVDGSSLTLPDSAGVYFVYWKGDHVPFYCGQSGDLNYRLFYHFKDAASNRRDSTLKKQFPEDDRGLEAMADKLVLKYIEVPIGRTEVEAHFHHKFAINTKRDRTQKKTGRVTQE